MAAGRWHSRSRSPSPGFPGASAKAAIFARPASWMRSIRAPAGACRILPFNSTPISRPPRSTYAMSTSTAAFRGHSPSASSPPALEREQRKILEMTAGSWLSFREFNGLLLYYTHLMSYRCAIREVRIGLNSTIPDRAIAMPPCNQKDPMAIPADAQPYLKVPPATGLVSVELTYRDGSVSEVKTFRR